MGSLQLLLSVFWAFGLSSWNLNHGSMAQKFLMTWQVVHIGLFFVQNAIVFTHIEYIFASLNVITFLTDFIQYLGPMLAHLVIVVEAFRYRETQRKLERIFNELRVTFGRLDPEARFLLDAALRRFLGELVVVSLACWISEAVIMVRIYTFPSIGKYHWFYHWVCKMLPFSVGRMSLLHHAFLVNFMSVFMRLMTAELHNIGVVSRRREAVDWASIENSLLLMKRAYFKLADFNRKSNKIFGYSHVFNMLGLFILIAACWYYNCYNIKNLIPLLSGLPTFLCAVAPMLITLYFCLKCEAAQQSFKELCREVHRVEKPRDSHQVHQLVTMMGLQVRQQPIAFQARGFFGVGTSFLTDFISQTVSYIIIFVQFMPRTFYGNT